MCPICELTKNPSRKEFIVGGSLVFMFVVKLGGKYGYFETQMRE